MSLISCPLFTLQLKSYCSKIYSALAAAWLIPRLTLTGLLPVHTACHKPRPAPSWGCPAAGQRGRRPLGPLSHTSLPSRSREPAFPRPLADMPAKASSWCRPLDVGISPCSAGSSPQGLQEGSAWLRVVPGHWHLHQGQPASPQQRPSPQ